MSEIEQIKLCRDCVYCEVPRSGLDYSKCVTQELSGINLVSGERKFWFCSTARDHNFLCGPEGKYFLRREEPRERRKRPNRLSDIMRKVNNVLAKYGLVTPAGVEPASKV